MRFFLFSFFIVIISLGFAQATGFSPSSLIFNLSQGEESCQSITITSESETIVLSDSWAENKDIEWQVSLFNTSASEHGITINYPDELSLEERTAEVCISGDNLGEYHGVLLLREEQEGNTVVQMGIWIKLTVNEIQEEEPPQTTSSGGGDGGGSSVTTNITQQQETEQEEVIGVAGDTNDEEVTPQGQIEEEYKSSITGKAIEIVKNPKTIVGFLFLLAIAGIIIYYKNKRNI